LPVKFGWFQKQIFSAGQPAVLVVVVGFAVVVVVVGFAVVVVVAGFAVVVVVAAVVVVVEPPPFPAESTARAGTSSAVAETNTAISSLRMARSLLVLSAG
jgi:hypothetical protein